MDTLHDAPCNVSAAKKTQVPPPPEEMVDVANNTLLSAAIGASFEGSRQVLKNRRENEAISSPVAKQQRRAMAEARKQRLASVARAGLKGAGRFGGFSALFLGTKFFLGVYRDSRDYYNSTCGGLVAGGAMGMSIVLRMASVPGSTKGAKTGIATATLLRAVIMGSALGGVSGFAAGMLEDVIAENLPEEEVKLRLLKIEQTNTIARGEGRSLTRFGSSNADPVGDVIRQLEAQHVSSNISSSNGGQEHNVGSKEQGGTLEFRRHGQNTDQAKDFWWKWLFWWRRTTKSNGG